MRVVVYILFLWLAFIFIDARAQYFPKDKATSPQELTDALINYKNAKTNQLQLKALLQLSSCYLFKPGEEQTDLDSAMFFANKAQQLSTLVKDQHGFDEATKLTVGALYEKNDHQGMFSEIKKLSGAARISTLTYWGDHYFYISYGYRPMKLIYLDTAWVFYKQKLLVSMALKDENFIKQSIGHLEHLIRICIEQKNAERVKQQSDWFKEHTRPLNRPYPSILMSAMLAEQAAGSGEYALALERSLYSLKLLNDKSTPEERFWTYGQMGQIYRFTGKYEKSNTYYFKLMDMADQFAPISIFISAYFVCNNYRQLKQIDKAVSFIADIQKQYKPKDVRDESYLYRTLAENYTATKQLDLALKNWMEAKRILDKVNQNTTAINLYIGAIYSDMGKYEDADKAYEQCEKARQDLHIGFLASLYDLRAQIKERLGDHHAALIYLHKNKRITDSIYTVSKEKHGQELDIQYETQKKEAQLKQRAENIRFLAQKNRLQQQNAQLQETKLKQAEQLAVKNKALIGLKERTLALKSKDLSSVSQIASLQKTQLVQAGINKKVTAAIIGLLLLIISMIVYQYRQKQRTSLIVTKQNQQLNNLLTEKEWLLKEVHHRVKNNLQTIVNLLESQSDHLEEPALTAIETSKNRIFAMSLLHHKLYQADESSTIDMALYINELVSFLRDTFSAHSTAFCINVDSIRLDIGKAIPIGLIINEAVTNSLKHAFNGISGGTISIHFKEAGQGSAQLTIADNGSGIPNTEFFDAPTTMGLKLIKGLTKQLDAELKLETGSGTTFVISGIELNNL